MFEMKNIGQKTISLMRFDEVFRPITFFIPNVMKKKNYKLHFSNTFNFSQITFKNA
jgi:hypothetical protein